jgi:hypothetical protein
MDKRIFWVIIEATLEQSGGETASQESLIKDQLHNFDFKDLIGFQANCLEFMNGLYSSEIWAAEYVLLNSCSEDSFTEFRGWLITQGENAYMNAVNNADSIYDLIQKYDILNGYLPQLSLDVLVYDVARKKWDVNQNDFKKEVISLLNKKGFEPVLNINFNWNKQNPETLEAIVPRLMNAYFNL